MVFAPGISVQFFTVALHVSDDSYDQIFWGKNTLNHTETHVSNMAHLALNIGLLSQRSGFLISLILY